MSKNVRLKKLSLTNYRNLEHIELDFQGKDAAIVGENHIGKTNTLESLFVLLDNTLIDNSASIERIKPISDTKKVASIEATFDVDGEEFSVRKDYGEEWVRARGSDTLSLKGHFQKLYIQGTKVERAADYYSNIREKFGIEAKDSDKIDIVRMLLSPTYLGDMGEGKEWTAFRAFIIRLVGDVSDDDVFEKYAELCPIREDLRKQGGSVDNLKRKYKQDCDGLKWTISSKEAVIENLEKTEKPTDDAVSIAKRAIDEHDDAIAAIRQDKGSDVESERLQRLLSEKQSQLIALQDKPNPSDEKYREKIEAAKAKYAQASKELSDALSERSDALIQKQREEVRIKTLESERVSVSESANEPFIARIREIDHGEQSVEETCPTCGQHLPEEAIDEAKAKLAERLASERSDLIAKCKKNKARRAEIDADIVSAKESIAKIEDALDEISSKIEAAKAKMEESQSEASNIPAFERKETEEEASLKREIKTLEENLKESRSAFQRGVSDKNSAIVEHQEAKKPYQKTLDDLAYYQRQMENLAKEKEILKSMQRDLVSLEQKRELANQFLYSKLKMLDDKVAKVFGAIKFKLIQENINGGFDPVCKPYIFDTVKNESTGVPWASGSKSEKVETGIAILEAIKKNLGLPNIPLLFDEGGEISTDTMEKRLPTDSQIICVKVRDGIQSPTVLPL